MGAEQGGGFLVRDADGCCGPRLICCENFPAVHSLPAYPLTNHVLVIVQAGPPARAADVQPAVADEPSEVARTHGLA